MKSPDPTAFGTDLQQALCVLAANADSDEWLTTSEISNVLRKSWGIELHWRTITVLFEKNKELVTRRKRKHKWQYSVLAKGKATLAAPDTKVTVIDPKNAVQHLVTLHDQLATLKGSIYICDPYLDAATLEHLDSCDENTNLFLLTHNIQDTGRLRQLISAYANSSKSLEIRKTWKAILHDRYIIDKKGMLILGTSLNGYGKKQGFIINVGQDIRTTMLDTFKSIWANASQWPGA